MDKKRIIFLIVLIIILGAVFSIYYFTKEPALAELSLEVSSSPQELKQGDLVNINVKVFNNGERKAENILVQFFYNNPEGEKIEEIRIDCIEPGQSKDVSAQWQTKFGVHRIHVLIDSENQIQESNEENNKAVKALLVTLPIIKTEELSEKEFLEDSSVKELNDLAKEKGYTQLVSATHTEYEQNKESFSGVLFSPKDEKISYLIKFEEEVLLIEKQGENIILTSQDGKVEIQNGEVSVDLEEEYHSCDYNHCLLSCTIYFLVFDDLWGKVIDTACEPCKAAVKTGATAQAILVACTPCAAAYAGPTLGCATNCATQVGGNPCNWCLTDACGPTWNCHTPHCVPSEGGSREDVYELCDTYECINPLSTSSQCVPITDSVVKHYCSDISLKWGDVCKDNKVFWEALTKKSTCKDAECIYWEETETDFREDCSPISCPYPDQEGRTATCVAGPREFYKMSYADCYCCFDNNDCKQTEMYKTEDICYDEGSLGIKQYFHNYFCHHGNRKCALNSQDQIKKIQTESCGQDYIDYGEWECTDEKTKERTRILHKYYCFDAQCKKKVESILADKVTCSDRCLDGGCIGTECQSDSDCPEDTMEWGSWECQSDGKTLKRETLWWNDSYCSSDYKCLVDNSKTKTETKTCSGELPRCYANECMECLTDNDCSSGVCLNNECTGCANDNDCEYLEYEEYETSCDGNYLVTDTIKYNFLCDNNECLEQQGVIEDEPERYLCPRTCSNGQCVDCADESDCDSDYTQWGNWYCESDSVRKKDERRYTHQCLDSICVQSNELTGNSQTDACLPDEICQTGTCIKEYGLIIGADGLAVKYIDSNNYSFLDAPSSFTGNLYDADFYQGGALIAGDVASDGKILRYNGQNLNLIEVPLFPEGNYTGIEFKPGDLNYALIVGDKIVEWDLTNFNHIASGNYSGNDIAWKPDANYALIIEDAQVIKFIPSPQQISSLFIPPDILHNIPEFEGVDWLDAWLPLTELSWKPNGNEVFIISDIGLVLKYNGSSFSVDYDPNDVLYEVNLQGIDFKPDGSYALIVGSEGLIKKYDGTSFTAIPADSSIDFQGVAWISDNQALIVGARWTGGSAEAIALLFNASTNSLTTVISGISGSFIGVNW